jgi:hypothetical protein
MNNPCGKPRNYLTPLQVAHVLHRIVEEAFTSRRPLRWLDELTGPRPLIAKTEIAGRCRCWRYDWVLDLDVKAYFDNIDWELLLKAVHTDCPWVLLYIERWL